jgi:osmotically-inducible protein OsmY
MPADQTLEAAIRAELDWEAGLAAAHIKVAVAAGTVTLTGPVATYAEALMAGAAAARVKGVKAIVNEVKVQLASEVKSDDAAIAAAAINRLKDDHLVPKRRIVVRVEQGWVTLTGQVDNWHQKAEAERDIGVLKGVVGLFNYIEIKPVIDSPRQPNRRRSAAVMVFRPIQRYRHCTRWKGQTDRKRPCLS